MNRPATARSRAQFRASVSARASVQALEERLVMSAAFDQTGLTDLRLNATFAGIDGSGVGVAVLDTGIYAAHPLLAPNVVAFYNAVETPLPATIHATSLQFARDLEGHGSSVMCTPFLASSIIAAHESASPRPNIVLSLIQPRSHAGNVRPKPAQLPQ